MTAGGEWVGSKGESERGGSGQNKKKKKQDAQTNASLGNRCNQLSQSANDQFHGEK